jgi:hypothetical protein
MGDIKIVNLGKFRRPTLRMAVQAAIAAYEKSGRMLDAALVYAAHGFPIVPASVKSKVPIAAADKDANGNKIPQTGGVYKATTDEAQIRAWWTGHEWLIALPMGERSGVWCLDVDTGEDHADGVAEWNKIIAEHDPIVTREHRSATGGPHLIFNWNAEQPIGCSSGNLPRGMEVKGANSYIIVPPSRRKGRSYTVFADIDPIDPPQFLLDQIDQNWSPPADNFEPIGDVDLDELADVLASIPNPDNWTEWKYMALRIYAAAGQDAGWMLFHHWAQKWEFYDWRAGPIEDRECWKQVTGSPPNRTGINKLYKIARENGWAPKPQQLAEVLDPTLSVEAARSLMRELVHDFLYLQVAYPKSEINAWIEFGYSVRNMPPVWGVMIDTGTGKTRLTIEEFADWIGKVTLTGPLIYAVPAHKLSAEIEQQFKDWGINARIFRGREQKDPDNPKKFMCQNLETVELAKSAHADINRTCCKNGKQECAFYKLCKYQGQAVDPESVQVWIVAADMLFYGHQAFGKPVAVIIDEAIWDKGLRGIGANPETLSIEDLPRDVPAIIDTNNPAAMHDHYRNRLAQALQQQKADGGVERQFLAAAFDVKECTEAKRLEWKFLPKIELRPGMSKAEIRKLFKTEILYKIHVGRLMIKVLDEIRHILEHPEIEISGRLLLTYEQRVLQWRGVAEIKDIFMVPTLVLDATLPDPNILRVYHPQAEIVAKIKVTTPPAVRIRQVVNAPTSSKKLDDEKHLAEVHRYILRRWYETGRGETLVVVQKKVEAYLKTRLPGNITVAHYNNIAGLDAFKNARLVILAGRTAPGPDAVETLAATLSGVQRKSSQLKNQETLFGTGACAVQFVCGMDAVSRSPPTNTQTVLLKACAG